jgi:hypothetical protein
MALTAADLADLIELLDPKTLKALDLPKTATSPQGLNNILMERSLQLVYNTNDFNRIPHSLDSKLATAMPAAGVSFTSPGDKRRIIFDIRLDFVATATVGTRTIQVTRTGKIGTAVDVYVQDAPTASQSRTYQIGPAGTSGNATVVVAMNYQIALEPEWSLTIRDASAIDVLDTIAWRIEYLEIAVS